MIARRDGNRLSVVPRRGSGPGKLLDVWIDKESREVAAETQRQRHLADIRHCGFPAIVHNVEHEEAKPRQFADGWVTVEIFSGVDPSMIEQYQKLGSFTIEPVESSLRNHDSSTRGFSKMTISTIDEHLQGQVGS